MTNLEARDAYFESNYTNIGPETIDSVAARAIPDGTLLMAENERMSKISLEEHIGSYVEVLRSAGVCEEDIQRNAADILSVKGEARALALNALYAVASLQRREHGNNEVLQPMSEGEEFRLSE